MTSGTLFIIPVPLGASDPVSVLPEPVLRTVRGLNRFIAEDAKSARAFLKAAQIERPLSTIEVRTWNEHSQASELSELIAPLASGEQMGLLSEAGYPAIADPGAEVIAAAHRAQVRVVPLVGPSSLLLALAASGLNGQSFAFHGYLPVPEQERAQALLDLEARSARERATQIFIEAPYRNVQMLDTLLRVCSPSTRLCLATELTLATESVRTLSVADWKKSVPDLNRRPTVFLFLAQAQQISAPSPKKPSGPALARQHSRSGGRSARRDSPSE